MSAYNMPGETLSEKSVSEQYHIAPNVLTEGIESGKLTCQWRSMHGHSYRLYIRSQISEFAKTCQIDATLKAAHDSKMLKQNLVEKRNRLNTVCTELSGIDARKVALTNEKQVLEQWLEANDPKCIKATAKTAAKVASKIDKESAKEAKKRKKDNEI